MKNTFILLFSLMTITASSQVINNNINSRDTHWPLICQARPVLGVVHEPVHTIDASHAMITYSDGIMIIEQKEQLNDTLSQVINNNINSRDTVEAWIVHAQLMDGAVVRTRPGFVIYDTEMCQPVGYLDSRFNAMTGVVIKHVIAQWVPRHNYYYGKHWPLFCVEFSGRVVREPLRIINH
jgi:hypothetical protein